MAVEVMDDFELEKLRAEIQQEKQMKEMLEQSAAELRATVEELEKRYDTIDNEGNEWKTRYETQTEINEQLERQILMLQNKVQEAKANLKDAGKTPRDLKNFDDLSDANPHMIRMLEKEKNVLMNQMRDMEWRLDQESKANKYMIRSLEKEKQMLQGQMRDIEWRLDQESKAYHKANDERKTYSLEINSTKGSINDFSTRTKLSSSRDALDTIPGSRTPRSMGNIPEDQRILDPKHGPIKKAAAVKSLPSLETT
uniref:Coiled-coil domain-containing protein 169 n=1 Tax=Magallana gigas TaxID=29159 RepID=A0A8W8LI40_MAGGI